MRVKTSKGELPVHFGMNTLATFGDLTNKSINEVMGSLRDMSSLKLSDMMKFFYASFIEGALEAGEECQITTPREVGSMLDEDTDLMTRMFTAYTKQSAPEDEVAPDEGKKK